MSKKKLAKFKQDFKNYQDLLRQSRGPLLNIEKNHKQIDELKSSLIAQFANLEDVIAEYSRHPRYADPVWRIPQDAYQLALSNDILHRRGPAIDAALNDLEYVIAKYEAGDKKLKTNPDRIATVEAICISLSNLHPKIIKHCKTRFESGHYSDAILNAYKVVLSEIKTITGIDKDGKPLVEEALSLNKPVIKLNSLRSQSDKDEQQGFMLLFSGAALGIRNPKAHELVNQDDPLKTLQYLSFASLLMDRLDDRLGSRPEDKNGS